MEPEWHLAQCRECALWFAEALSPVYRYEKWAARQEGVELSFSRWPPSLGDVALESVSVRLGQGEGFDPLQAIHPLLQQRLDLLTTAAVRIGSRDPENFIAIQFLAQYGYPQLSGPVENAFWAALRELRTWWVGSRERFVTSLICDPSFLLAIDAHLALQHELGDGEIGYHAHDLLSASRGEAQEDLRKSLLCLTEGLTRRLLLKDGDYLMALLSKAEQRVMSRKGAVVCERAGIQCRFEREDASTLLIETTQVAEAIILERRLKGLGMVVKMR